MNEGEYRWLDADEVTTACGCSILAAKLRQYMFGIASPHGILFINHADGLLCLLADGREWPKVQMVPPREGFAMPLDIVWN